MPGSPVLFVNRRRAQIEGWVKYDWNKIEAQASIWTNMVLVFTLIVEMGS